MRIIDSISVIREPVEAISFELARVEQVVSPDGTEGTDLTFLVTWPGCGVIDSSHSIDDGGRIHVDMNVFHDPAAFCAPDPTEVSHTVHVGGLQDSTHDLRAELRESGRANVAFVVEATFSVGGDGHHVQIHGSA